MSGRESLRPLSPPRPRRGLLPLLAPVALVVALATAGCAAPQTADCCSRISPAGVQMARLLDASGVDHLWRVGHHVDWQTGQPDGDEHDQGHGRSSHCSAFVAAIAERLGIYILRPPEHSQILLATAQVQWLNSDAARQQGWQPVRDAAQAQQLANDGVFVLAAFPNPVPRKPGHIAIVHPQATDPAQLQRTGPWLTQAGEENALLTTVREGFRHHRSAWPDGVVYYRHAVVAWPQPGAEGHQALSS